MGDEEEEGYADGKLTTVRNIPRASATVATLPISMELRPFTSRNWQRAVCVCTWKDSRWTAPSRINWMRSAANCCIPSHKLGELVRLCSYVQKKSAVLSKHR